MQKKSIILKNDKGIALITLLVAVLMMLIISSIIIYNTTNHLKVSNLNNMYNDIRLLNEQVFLYYSKNETLPVVDISYESGLDKKITGDYGIENFYVLDIDKIDKNIHSNLNYGEDYYQKKYTGTDLYVINKLTHQIFYVRGIEIDEKIYYTIPEESEYKKSEITNLVANLPILIENLEPVIKNENNAIIGTNSYDNKWYDYNEYTDLSKWARARGESDNDLYMWVPRYAYNKTTNKIEFLKGNTDEAINKKDISSEGWVIPDAFQNKEKEQLTGIWLSLGNDYNKINSTENLIKAIYELTGKDNTTGTANTSITGADYTYYNPVIPVGFKTVPTRDASWRSTNGIQVDGWNNGLVIEDSQGNQFMWVPSNGTNTVENSIAQTQINKYGGYYISKNNESEILNK